MDVGDPDAVADAILALTEQERAAAMVPLFEASQALRSADPEGTRGDPAAAHVGQLALLGAGTVSAANREMIGLPTTRIGPAVHARLAEVLASRPARVRAAWIRESGRYREWSPGWWVIRALERAGGVDGLPDRDAAYWRAAWAAVADRWSWRDEGAVATATSRLEDDAELAEGLARSFAIPGVADHLAAFSEEEFEAVLLPLVRSGALERGTLVDAALRGLALDQRPGAAGGLRRLVMRLEPTEAELGAHVPQLLAVLEQGRPAEHAQACAWLARAVGGGADLEPDRLVGAAAAAIEAGTKSSALAVLRAADALAPGAGDVVIARALLAHGHADVQRKGVARAVASGSADALAESRDHVTPAVRGLVDDALAAWGVQAAPAGGSAECGAAASPPGIGTDGAAPVEAAAIAAAVPAREAASPLEPVADPAALAAELTALIVGLAEPRQDPILLERVLDGLTRHNASGLEPALLDPVVAVISRRRVRGVADDGAVVTVYQYPEDALVLAWIEGADPPEQHGLVRASSRWLDALTAATWRVADPWPGGWGTHPGGRNAVLARWWEAVAASAHPRPSLALPTDTHGWLAPRELAARLETVVALGAAVGRHEAAHALARLDVAAMTADALARLASIDHPVARSARALAGEDVAVDDAVLASQLSAEHDRIEGWSLTSKDTPWGRVLEVSAPRLAPERDRATVDVVDPASLAVGSMLGRAAHGLFRPPIHPLHGGDFWDGSLESWALTVAPRRRDAVLGGVACDVVADPDSPRRERDEAAAVLSLGWSDAAAGDGARLLVAAVALSALPDPRAALVDVGAAALDLLGGREVGELAGRLVALGAPGLARMAAVVTQLAQAGAAPGAAAWCAGAVVAAGPAHRELCALLEAWEIALDRGGAAASATLADGDVRTVLADASAGSSKRAKAARRLLAHAGAEGSA
ncbi:hypothetical protein [Demequina sp. NBRC 110056]|uniref:hypothetical protein n=1 Tax=Demequina sp. NBRC 110056 TaxID=1570345 RepID=UPI0009FDCDF0|nr:hypothetical protein [Demequina sp. NBRC 110056]